MSKLNEETTSVSSINNEEKLFVTNKLVDNIEHIISLAVEKGIEVNKEQFRKAYNLAVNAHKNQILPNGEPFHSKIYHILTILILDFKIDYLSLLSAVLVEAGSNELPISQDLIKKDYGATVAEIVFGLNQINKVETNLVGDSSHIEQFRKVLFSLMKDVRIIFIKIAERLFLLRNLDYSKVEKQKKIASEVMEVYVPFVNRFGLRNIKWELEDLCFKFTNRDAFEEIRQKLDGTRNDREKYVNLFIKPIESALKSDELLKSLGVKYQISGRAKHIYSIYNKIHARQKPMEELYDLIAVRVILDNADKNICFYVYGLIAAIYPPLPETFKDYINSGKQNGYQSIHTAVSGPGKMPVEVQIRTMEMHEVSEKGVAAHFNYKRGLVPASSIFDNSNAQEWMDAVREIIENPAEQSPSELLNSVKSNLFIKEIYVFTPKNQIMNFPLGSTVLDFAFAIHSDLGYHFLGAKVNGKVVPIDYKLQSGDQIEILTSQKQLPKKEWINYGVTLRTKSFLNKYFKNEDKHNADSGRIAWNEFVKSRKLKIDSKLMIDLLERIELQSEFDLHIAYFKGEVKQDLILKHYLEITEIRKAKAIAKKETKLALKREMLVSLFIKGLDRPGLVRDITKVIINQEGVVLNSVSFDTFQEKFDGNLIILVKNKTILDKLLSAIKQIENVNSIDWKEK
jgi:RelA/SpoT family (p)ppGpp synthetase